MQSRTHAATGALAGVGIGVLAAHGLEPAATLALAASGAALIPDLDHPSSAISRSLGPLTKLLSRGAAAAGGGHRGLTHSAMFAAGSGLLAAALAVAINATGHPWGPALVLGMLAALGSRTILQIGAGPNSRPWLPRRTRHLLVLLAAGATGYAAFRAGLSPELTGVVVAGGCLAHLAGDLISGGVPLLWPARRQRVVLARFRTRGKLDRALSPGLLLVSIAALALLAR